MKVCHHCGKVNNDTNGRCVNCNSRFGIRNNQVLARNNDLHLVQCSDCGSPFNVVNPRNSSQVARVTARSDHGFFSIKNADDTTTKCPNCDSYQIINWTWF